jgi:hypothetical protein
MPKHQVWTRLPDPAAEVYAQVWLSRTPSPGTSVALIRRTKAHGWLWQVIGPFGSTIQGYRPTRKSAQIAAQLFLGRQEGSAA